MIPAIIGAGFALAKSPIGKAVGGFVGKLFKKKQKKGASARQFDPRESIASAQMAATVSPTYQGIQDNGSGPIVKKAGEILSEVTKGSRQFETSISPTTIGLLAGLVLLAAFVFSRK